MQNVFEVKIFSHWRFEVWHGEFLSDLDGRNPEALLDEIYRAFQRVTEVDHERMFSMGYALPSLSMNDMVQFKRQESEGHFETWLCEAVGWKMVL
jgi:hypothetical protein